MNTLALFAKRDVYGRELLYPANATAEGLCRLARQKTFLREDLHKLTALGFRVQLEGDRTEFIEPSKGAAQVASF